MNAFLLALWFLCWTTTIYCVYQGGRTLNDHVVALFVTLCMAVYLVWWSICPYELLSFGLTLGPLSMTFLFVILLRREEVQNPFLFGGLYLSQVGYGLSLFGWGICIPYYVGAAIFDVPLWNDWIFACTALCTFWGVLYTYLRYEHCNRYQLGQLGVRIVQLSDIHISPTMTELHLEQLIERVNALEADVLLATGDFVMPFSEDNHDHLYRSLQRSTAPVFACLGNHDLPVRDKMIEEFIRHGIHILVDEYQIISCKGRRLVIDGCRC